MQGWRLPAFLLSLPLKEHDMAFFAFAAFLDECQERALLTLSLFPKIHTESVHAKKEPSRGSENRLAIFYYYCNRIQIYYLGIQFGSGIELIVQCTQKSAVDEYFVSCITIFDIYGKCNMPKVQMRFYFVSYCANKLSVFLHINVLKVIFLKSAFFKRKLVLIGKTMPRKLVSFCFFVMHRQRCQSNNFTQATQITLTSLMSVRPQISNSCPNFKNSVSCDFLIVTLLKQMNSIRISKIFEFKSWQSK